MVDMYLKKLETQGFKTFAKKTSLSFLPPEQGRCPVTAVVGPNGSGKSNFADAIRWVLGEQSLKLLRGKHSHDVIFSGSQGRARSGFAEVTLTFDNTDGSMPIEYPEVVITRRLFRDGSSEYLLNESKVRLSDIQLLLAQANVGQRSYSVVGQGMIDHILVSSPEERKAFFDDATGVKPFQIKRREAFNKLKRTIENLEDVQMVLSEIEPRLRSLKRQANRLQQRDEVETKLHALEAQHYGAKWWELVVKLEGARDVFAQADKAVAQGRSELKELEKTVVAQESVEPEKDEGLSKLQQAYRELGRKRNQLRDEAFKAEKEIELSRVRAQSNWAPLPLLKIVEEVDALVKGLKEVRSKQDITLVLDLVESLLKQSTGLSKRLKRPNPEDIKPDPTLTEKLKNKRTEEQVVKKELEALEKEIDAYATKEKTERTELIEAQRALREKQRAIHLEENRRNSLQIDVARFEERQQALKREMQEFMKDRASKVLDSKFQIPNSPQEDVYSEIQRLRYKLELIGGIDPEIIQEYEEISQRHEFLSGQVGDLQQAIRATEKIILELDEQIEKQSKKVFAQINKEFQKYFQILFGGGSCAIVKVVREEDPDEEPAEGQEAPEKNKRAKPAQEGVEIQATPPGKRLKSLNLLSGGERALTSIALISAIMAVNPAPFVVLDEVDAALDEANTIRFATILDELSKNSQFIIITHNRATMEKADVLYGVTMGEDGVSNLLSVHLEDVASGGTARR